jgi:phage protein D
MDKVSYKLTIGTYSINSADDPRTELVALETSASLNSAGDSCHLYVYAPPAPKPGLLEQAVTAAAGALGVGGGEESFAVQVRGENVKHGDLISVELTAGGSSAKVMTAEVHSITSSLGQTKITGRTGLEKLANVRLNHTYENQSLSQIVRDLAGQAGITTGEVATGSTYPYLLVHEWRNLLSQLRELARRDGLDLYFDAENKLTLKKFDKSSADHTFYYGIDILDLSLFNHRETAGRLVVYGESPVSSQGADTWHWAAKDLSPFRGEVGRGRATLAVQDAALRTKDAADSLAAAKLGAAADAATGGRLKLLGRPQVTPADAIEIREAPKPELNGLFKVAQVRHVFSKREGYVTYVGFTGRGGAQKAGGMPGGVGKQLAGAVGL